MHQRRRLTNEEKFELLKMYYKEGRTDFTGTKYEGYNVPSIRVNLREKYNNRTLKMDPELLKKFEREYFLQRERNPRKSDEEKYLFLMEFRERNPKADRSKSDFNSRYKEGKKVKAYITHLQTKHNRGKDLLTQEQIENLLDQNLLHYSPREKEEIAEKYAISIEWIDKMQARIGRMEHFENVMRDTPEKLSDFPLKDRFIWKGKKDATEEQKLAYVRLVKSAFRLETPNLECLIVDSELIDEKIGTLMPREKTVLRKRFGLDTGMGKARGEIGQEFDVTQERIRQIEEKALSKMRHSSRRQEVDENMLSYKLRDNMDKKKELEEKIESFEAKKDDYEEILREDNINKLGNVKSINDLDLSIRTYNCLYRKGIKTVEELTEFSIEDIEGIRNMGKKSLKELLRKTRRIRNCIRRR